MDDLRPKPRRPLGRPVPAPQGRHHIESVAHHFLAGPALPEVGPQESSVQLLVATRSAARATAAWTARLVRAVVGTGGAVATDERLASCCELSERAGLEWSVGSYFAGQEPRVLEYGEPGAELAPGSTGRGRVWRIDGEVPVDPADPDNGDLRIHHLGRIKAPFLDWCEAVLPESEPQRRHVLWCIQGGQPESWAEAHLLGRLLLACGAERLTVVQLPADWPSSASPWRRRIPRWAGRSRSGEPAERLAELAAAVAPQVRVGRWNWDEGRTAAGSRHWRRLLADR